MPGPTYARATRRCATAAMVALIALLTSAEAWADVVGPPPTDCPSGSRGDSCHGGEYCTPQRCTDDTSCVGDATCQELALCVGRVDCASGWDPDGAPSYQDTVTGSCADGATCTSGSCDNVWVCASPDLPGAGASSPGDSQVVEQGCGCRLERPAPISGALGMGALTLLGLYLRRRRAKRS